MLSQSNSSLDRVNNLNGFGLSAEEVFGILTTFTPVGLWRLDLDSGHTFCDAAYSRIYGIKHTDGPINMMEYSSRIHPDELSAVMECYEIACQHPMAFQKVHRISPGNNAPYRYVCTIGRFRAKPGTSGELVGVAFEVHPHRCDFRYETDSTVRAIR